MKNKFLEAQNWLLSLPRSKKNYGLVHADLLSHNLFLDYEQRIHVIDFDDSCYHWHAFDIAVFISHIAHDDGRTRALSEQAVWLEHLLEGYKKVRRLDDEDIKKIPKFIDFACLRFYF